MEEEVRHNVPGCAGLKVNSEFFRSIFNSPDVARVEQLNDAIASIFTIFDGQNRIIETNLIADNRLQPQVTSNVVAIADLFVPANNTQGGALDFRLRLSNLSTVLNVIVVKAMKKNLALKDVELQRFLSDIDNISAFLVLGASNCMKNAFAYAEVYSDTKGAKSSKIAIFYQALVLAIKGLKPDSLLPESNYDASEMDQRGEVIAQILSSQLVKDRQNGLLGGIEAKFFTASPLDRDFLTRYSTEVLTIIDDVQKHYEQLI